MTRFSVPISAPPTVSELDGNVGGTGSLQSMMWMFVAILVTFVVTRTITRLIRSGSSGALGDISLGGHHIHHQVWGILIMVGTGIVLVSTTPQGNSLDIAAAVFGVGISLTLDEFALWLHLEDVYWKAEGRKSVDAMFCVLAVTGLLIGGTDFLPGAPGTSAWWGSMAALAVNLIFSIICVLKGKIVVGIVGIVVVIVAIVGAIRLAKPRSWWGVHRYADRPKRLARSRKRFGERYDARWNRLRDLVAGQPNVPDPEGPVTPD